MANTALNVGVLFVTLAVLFTTYFASALAMPKMPNHIQQTLASLPTLADSPSVVICDRKPQGR
jgi:hypothetical protein